MRKIAIYDSFTEPKHRRLIDETAGPRRLHRGLLRGPRRRPRGQAG